MGRAFVLLLLLSIGDIASVPSVAAPAAEPSESYASCIQAAHAVDPKMLECADTELSRQDKELNAVYAELMKRSDGNAKEALRKAQRAWVAFRDAEALYINGKDGGSLDRIMAVESQIALTTARTAQLRNHLKRVL
jgi:uncharacterized protein YecT (DUF1311 family)